MRVKMGAVPWRGLARHLTLTLRLNFRSRQPLIYGYLVPVFFLLAFGSVFRTSSPPLLNEMGQLLTITILGGACFGLPTAMVAERERGLWRRYRLLPAAATGIVLSTVVARVILLFSAVVLQVGLAALLYGTPWPAHPWQLVGAFGAAAFAFLGLGLLIAMLADNVPAVQALGQVVFLPMIMIGGVGVPLHTLPIWAQRVAAFLPGRYAVEALQACVGPTGGGLARAGFALAALGIIGAAGFVAAAGLFRWEKGSRAWSWQTRGWVGLALAAWLGVGLVTEMRRPEQAPARSVALKTKVASKTTEPWRGLSEADITAIRFDDLPPDDGYVVPLAKDFSQLNGDEAKRIDALRDRLAYWPPGTVEDPVQRVRNLLSVCAVADLVMDADEGEIARAVFDQIPDAVRDATQRRQVLAWIVLHPAEGTVLTDLPGFGIAKGAEEPFVRDRCAAYARKMLRDSR